MIAILQGKAETRIREIKDNSIQLTVTSPPFGKNIRQYTDGNRFDFDLIAKELYRVTCDSGVVAWNEGLTCEACDEQPEPYLHVLGFRAAGFKLLQTLIVKKDSIPFPGRYRCGGQFEFCWLFLKGKKPSVFNKDALKDRPNRQAGQIKNVAIGRRGPNDERGKTDKKILIRPMGYRSNVWENVPVGWNKTTKDKIAYDHPALMSEHLAKALILAYSNPANKILDCFSGLSTTLKMAELNHRNSVGLELSKVYVQKSLQRLKPYTKDIKVS